LQAGTDVVVGETVRSVGTLASGKNKKEEITLALENGRRYDIRVTVWQDGRMRESGSVNVFLPDRTVTEPDWPARSFPSRRPTS